ALHTNLEAADEVARQLRLRDLAGLIVIDFIDMDENRNNRAVEKRMKDRLKNDRARIQIGRISAFGLMEMSRQRLRPGMLEATTQPCPVCHGTGLIRSDESLSLSILREIEEEGLRGRADELTVRVPIDVLNYLINTKRQHIAQIEERHGIAIAVLADPALRSPDFEVERSKSGSGNRRAQKQPEVVTAGSVVSDEDVAEDARTDGDDGKAKRRRGKRGGRRKRGEQPEVETQESEEQSVQADDGSDEEQQDDRPRGRKRGGRRRGGRGRKPQEDGADQQAGDSEDATVTEEASRADAPTAPEAETSADQQVPSSASVDASTADVNATADEMEVDTAATVEAEVQPSEPSEDVKAPEADPEPEPIAESEPVVEATAEAEPKAEPDAPPKPKRRGWWSLGR
ncbi:MAG: ribonuclease E/G, partial [Pseudomonadota bacterium]